MAPRVARIAHAALLGGAAATTVLLSVVRGVVIAPVTAAPIDVLRWVTLGVFVANVVAAQVFRGRIPPLAPGVDEAAWWTQHLAKAIVVWALLEGAALFGAVIHFATGDWVPLGIAAVGLVLLWVVRPARLVET
jgi:hypothetical protein